MKMVIPQKEFLSDVYSNSFICSFILSTIKLFSPSKQYAFSFTAFNAINFLCHKIRGEYPTSVKHLLYAIIQNIMIYMVTIKLSSHAKVLHKTLLHNTHK